MSVEALSQDRILQIANSFPATRHTLLQLGRCSGFVHQPRADRRPAAPRPCARRQAHSLGEQRRVRPGGAGGVRGGRGVAHGLPGGPPHGRVCAARPLQRRGPADVRHIQQAAQGELAPHGAPHGGAGHRGRRGSAQLLHDRHPALDRQGRPGQARGQPPNPDRGGPRTDRGDRSRRVGSAASSGSRTPRWQRSS